MLADPNLWHPLRSGPMARWGAPMIPRQFETLAELVRGPGSVLVANPGVLAARLVQEKFGVPMASLLLQPGLLPSGTVPPEMTGGLTIPPWLPHPLRRLCWLAVDAAGYLLVARELNRVRAGLDLPPIRRVFRCGCPRNWRSAYSRRGTRHRSRTGRHSSGSPDSVGSTGRGVNCRPTCRRSARSGRRSRSRSAPGWRTRPGSSAPPSPRVNRSARGILLTRFPNLVPSRRPPTIRHCGFAPFRELLPPCGAVVHHGGIGTTAVALEAGCPQLILPLAWDQPDNADRVVRLGAGASLGRRHRTSGPSPARWLG